MRGIVFAVLRVIAQWFGVYNVKWYGAKGDWNGTTGTDDTTAIQAAMNACTGATRPGVVYFPPGRYRVTAKLTATGRAIHMLGAGNRWSAPDAGDYPEGTSEIVGTGATILGTDVLSLNDGGTQAFGFTPVIENLSVNKSGTSTGGANIRINCCIGGVLRNTTVYKCYDGIVVQGKSNGWQGCWDQNFHNVHVHNAVRDGFVIGTAGTTNTYEVGEVHITNLITGAVGRHGVYIAGGSYIHGGGWDIQNCASADSTGNCLKVAGNANYVFLTQCGFEGGNTSPTHIYLGGSSDHIYFTNCYRGGGTSGNGVGLHCDGAHDVRWIGGTMGPTSSTSVPVVKVSAGGKIRVSDCNFAHYHYFGTVACPILETTALIDQLRFDNNHCAWNGPIDLGPQAHTNLSVCGNSGVSAITYPTGLAAQGINGSQKVAGNQVAGTWA